MYSKINDTDYSTFLQLQPNITGNSALDERGSSRAPSLISTLSSLHNLVKTDFQDSLFFLLLIMGLAEIGNNTLQVGKSKGLSTLIRKGYMISSVQL